MTKPVLLRLPDDLAERIDERAAKVGLSRNAWAVRALQWAVEQPVTKRTRTEEI
jgi:predicted HicB family RNase H-like nuclease